jgi:hypothetical protein
MSAADTLHRLLFQALLEIRSQGHEARNKAVFRLADLFHNIVLEMQRAAGGEASYEDVLSLLQELAAEKGCENWLARQMDQLPPGPAPLPTSPTRRRLRLYNPTLERACRAP